jgi:hypothetical protein
MTWLPVELRDLVEAAGLPAAIKLAEARPGERVFIPKSIPPDHWIAATVGAAAATRIARRLGGSHLALPTSVHRGPRAARRACDAALAEGASINEAVRASGLSHRAVQWRKAHKALPAANRRGLPKPPDLFD